MTEAERLRAQAERCTHLANGATDKNVGETLLVLAAKSIKEASELERYAVD